jgi:hypothetical protein
MADTLEEAKAAFKRRYQEVKAGRNVPGACFEFSQ